MDIVTYDGDGNGATTMQTKIQLWNRTGEGWPDVVFSQQVNDPVWMAQEAVRVRRTARGPHPRGRAAASGRSTSTAQCTVDGKQYCVQDNLAQVVLWVNQKKMDEFGYTVPTTWQEWAALGEKVAAEHPGYIVGNIGDSYSHWIYLWGNQCPLQQLEGDAVKIDAADEHCTRTAELLDPLIENGTVPPLSVFTPDFAQTYGGADDKVLLMPGPAWYAQAVFDDGLHIPAGEMTGGAALQWEDEPVTTGQVGGGPWIISRHSKDLDAAADFVTCVTTEFNPTGKDARPGYPAYAPAAEEWLADRSTNPYFAADPDAGAADRCRPDLAGLEPGDLPGPARLDGHGGHASWWRASRSARCWNPSATRSRTRPKRLGMPSSATDGSAAPSSGPGHASAWPARVAGLRVRRPLPAAADPVRRSCRCSTRVWLAFTNESGGWAGFQNFTDTATDYRFMPALVHVLVYTSVWLSLLVVLVVGLALLLHGRASRASSTFRFLYYLPGALAGAASVLVWLFMLDPSVSPGSFLVRTVLGRGPLRRGDRAREAPLHLRDDRVLDRGRRLGGRPLRRAQHDPAGAGGRRAHRRGGPADARPAPEAAAHPQVGRLHGHPVLRDRHPALRRAAAGEPGEPGHGPRHLVVQPAGLPAGLPLRATSTPPPPSPSTCWRSAWWPRSSIITRTGLFKADD